MSDKKGFRAFSGIGSAIFAGIVFLALLVPASAGAATVVNGDFEIGSLSGWHVYATEAEGEPFAGWFAYSGTLSPYGEVIAPPPQGSFAATSDEEGPSTHVLYQDVTLEPFFSHTLNMVIYYHSDAPIAVPTPNSLDWNIGPANQQYRVDVINPSAPIESLGTGNVLMNIFATRKGDPEEMGPTSITANLTRFAGQTIRLRFADVNNEGFLNSSADAISIVSTPPSNTFTLGALKLNKKNGTATIPVTVPGAGILTVADAHPTGAARASAASTSRRKKAYKPLIKPVTLSATAAGQLSVGLKPSGPGRKILAHKGKLRLNVAYSYTPTGGAASTQTVATVLRWTRHKPKHH
jgi:hypothetical protein